MSVGAETKEPVALAAASTRTGNLTDTPQDTTASCTGSIDVCTHVGLQPGDRIEVKWDLHVDVPMEKSAASDAADPGGSDVKTPNKKSQTQTITRWWGATLLQPDGRTHVLSDDGGDFLSSPVPTPKKPADAATVPLRVLDYDPCVEYGFPERSLEEVVFLSDHNLLNMSSGTRAHYRREGTAWEPTAVMQIGEDGLAEADLGQTVGGATAAAAESAVAKTSNDEAAVTVSGEEGIRNILDSVLMKALGGVSDKMGKLDAAQQRIVAGKIAEAKEKLVAKMLETHDESNGGGAHIITPELVKRCMEEMGQDL